MNKNDCRRTLLNYFDSKEDLNKTLNTIGYRNFDNEGNHWGFSTNGHFDEYFNQCMLNSCESTYKNELTKVIDKQQTLFLRLGQPSFFNPFHSQLYSNGIWNVVAYYRESNCFVEGYYFCGASPEDAAKLINCMTYIDTISKEISNTVSKQENIEIHDSKLDFSFSSPFSKFEMLSEREKICLIKYTLGKSTKQIANTLVISTKSVETYILRSKFKLGIKNKDQLLEFLLQSFSNGQLLEFSNFLSNRYKEVR